MKILKYDLKFGLNVHVSNYHHACSRKIDGRSSYRAEGYAWKLKDKISPQIQWILSQRNSHTLRSKLHEEEG